MISRKPRLVEQAHSPVDGIPAQQLCRLTLHELSYILLQVQALEDISNYLSSSINSYRALQRMYAKRMNASLVYNSKV